MIEIPLSYIITAIVALITGGFVGFWIGFRMGKHQLYEVMIKAKNPEIWNLAHYVKTDEEETKKITATSKKS
jgi:hypothetical protein